MQENGFALFLTVKRTSMKFWKMFFLVSSSLPRPWRKTDNHLAWWTWSKAKLQLIISFRKRRNKSKSADHQLLMNMRSKVSNSGTLISTLHLMIYSLAGFSNHHWSCNQILVILLLPSSEWANKLIRWAYLVLLHDFSKESCQLCHIRWSLPC